MSLSIKDFSSLVSKQENIENNGSSVNPYNHLIKLFESHGYKDEDNVINFFMLLKNAPDEFFLSENMPQKWSLRTYSTAMESLYLINKHDNVKSVLIELLGEDEYNELLDSINNQKKKYMNEYKKENRKKKKDDGDIIDVYKEGISMPMLSTSSTPSTLSSVSNSPMTSAKNSPSNSQLPTPLSSSAISLTNTDKSSSFVEDDESMGQKTQSDDVVIPYTKVQIRIQRIVDMLHNYMEQETDEFKVLYLDVVCDHLQRIFKDD